MKAGIKRANFAVARTLVRWLVRPVAAGVEHVAGEHLVYALDHRSLTDLIVLDILAERHGLPRPLEALAADGLAEARRFFFLSRGAGALRRYTMREYSARMLRLERWLLEQPEANATLVPVSIFWGRAAHKERSLVRTLFSEHWAITSRFRRFLSLFFNRTDVLAQFGAPLSWREAIDPRMDQGRMTRRTARLLRVKFRNQRTATLGPDLSHRRTLVDGILASRPVRDAIERDAAPQKAQARARRYANGIASDMSYPAVRFLNRVLTWFWHRIYDGLEVSGLERLAETADTHTLIYVPSHRSHIDYLLLSYVLFHHGLMIPHIAAGENMNMPVAGPLLRRGGAFFMRRSFLDDQLYTAIFAEYLHRVLWRGHSVEYFIEGGRSRMGRLRRPRTGLLKMTLRSVQRGVPRPIALVPVYIGYEKLIEAGAYLEELRSGDKGRETLRGVFRSFRLARQSFGKAAVNFGEPLELDAFMAMHPGEQAAKALGVETLQRINGAASINAVNLVALSTLSMPRQAMDEPLLHEQIDCLRELLSLDAEHLRYRVTSLPAADAVTVVERLGLLRRERQAFGDVLSHDASSAVLMTWYRNNVLHAFAAPALVACLLVNRRRRASQGDVVRNFNAIFPYVQGELFAPSPGADAAQRWLGHLARAGLVWRDGEGRYAAPAPETRERLRLKLLANALRQTIERFYIVISAFAAAPVGTQQALAVRCGDVAHRMSRMHGIDAPEFFDAELFHRFIDALVERGAVRKTAEGVLCAEAVVGVVARAARQVLDDEFRQAVALFLAAEQEQMAGGAGSPASG